jgi:hypothetical protein
MIAMYAMAFTTTYVNIGNKISAAWACANSANSLGLVSRITKMVSSFGKNPENDICTRNGAVDAKSRMNDSCLPLFHSIGNGAKKIELSEIAYKMGTACSQGNRPIAAAISGAEIRGDIQIATSNTDLIGFSPSCAIMFGAQFGV